MADHDRPLIVQSDRTVLLETDGPAFEPARDRLARFAELVKSPEYVHTYRITPLTIWNAAASGMGAEEMVGALEGFARYPVPASLALEIRELAARYGRLRLRREPGGELRLTAADPVLLSELLGHKSVAELAAGRISETELALVPGVRGRAKLALIKLGYPLDDRAGYVPGEPLALILRPVTRAGRPLGLRRYQERARDAFYMGGGSLGGSGVVVLPCGAGKTLVGMSVMAAVQEETLILVTSEAALHQWRSELLDKTTLPEDAIGDYSGAGRQIRPVTIATYQILTYRARRTDPFRHFALFDRPGWGLIIYDEVHLLPAPVFRATAEVQAVRRLGLTATLVREDGREADVFSLIGPKRYDVPWKELESQGWIAVARCIEVRVPFDPAARLAYAHADVRQRFRIASTNPAKLAVLARILAEHAGEPTLVIGQYLDQLRELAERLGAPLVTGLTPAAERELLYGAFRRGELALLVVSKVANFAIDLPEASVAVQVSGTFGSRQEEAQRLGRILRPKADGRPAHFYSLVTRDSREQDFALKRQLFLVEQGYRYSIEVL